MQSEMINTFTEKLTIDKDELHLKVNKTLVISCGETSITFHADGKLYINANELVLNGEHISLNAKRLDLCP